MNSSNQSPDLRARRTYRFLWEALLSLMAEQDFESITVTAICQRAMIHRTTFYKHYEDKYGLLAQGIHDELKLLFDVVDVALAKPATINHPFDPKAHLVAVFEHVLKQKHVYRLILTGNDCSAFSTLLKKSLAEHLERRLQREGKPTSMPLVLHAQLHAATMVGLLAWWLEHDCRYSPIEMLEYPWQEVFGGAATLRH